MLNDANNQKFLPQLGFDHFDYVTSVNLSGELAVLSNNDNVYMSVLTKNSRATHLLVYDFLHQSLTLLSGVYGPAKSREKKRLLGKPIPIKYSNQYPMAYYG